MKSLRFKKLLGCFLLGSGIVAVFYTATFPDVRPTLIALVFTLFGTYLFNPFPNRRVATGLFWVLITVLPYSAGLLLRS